jgi:type VI secretion system Hcp family effector
MFNSRIITCALAAVVTSYLAVMPAQAQDALRIQPRFATQIFLTWPGIVGPSNVPGHVGDIVLTSYSASIATPSTTAGPPTHSQVVITKAIDKTSALFFQMAVNGHVTPTVTVTFASGPAATTFYTVTLQDVLITSITQSDSPSEIITETITLTYSHISVVLPGGGIVTFPLPLPLVK